MAERAELWLNARVPAVWARLRAELRARVRAMIVLTVVVGIAGGAALTALAGARRTDTAMSRFLVYAQSAHAYVGTDPALYPRVRRLPQVEGWAEAAFMLMAPVDPSGRVQSAENLGTYAVVANHGGGRPFMLAGRMPHQDRAGEVLVLAASAAEKHIGVGSHIRLRGWVPSEADAVLRGTDVPPTGPVVDVRVVGVGRLPNQISTSPSAPGVIYTGTDFALLTPAFFRAYGDQIAVAGGVGLEVRLKHGEAGFPAFRRAVARISPDAQVQAGT